MWKARALVPVFLVVGISSGDATIPKERRAHTEKSPAYITYQSTVRVFTVHMAINKYDVPWTCFFL